MRGMWTEWTCKCVDGPNAGHSHWVPGIPIRLHGPRRGRCHGQQPHPCPAPGIVAMGPVDFRQGRPAVGHADVPMCQQLKAGRSPLCLASRRGELCSRGPRWRAQASPGIRWSTSRASCWEWSASAKVRYAAVLTAERVACSRPQTARTLQAARILAAGMLEVPPRIELG